MVNRLIPLRVRFSGLEFDPMDLLQSRQLKNQSIPAEWSRIRFEIMHSDVSWEKNSKKIETWIRNNTDGRWSWYNLLESDKRVIIVAFELDVDAVMFRLKSGEIAWQEENKFD